MLLLTGERIENSTINSEKSSFNQKINAHALEEAFNASSMKRGY